MKEYTKKTVSRHPTKIPGFFVLNSRSLDGLGGIGFRIAVTVWG